MNMSNPDSPDHYSAKVVEQVSHGKGYWYTLKVGIFADKYQIGVYERNYSRLYRTFCPFKAGGKMYALYSRDYTSTRVMELPSCKDLGGEERDELGFCPVDYFVPRFPHGFVAGCIWGDDSSWKIRYVDLSGIAEGKIKVDDRFGYIELLPGMELKNAVRMYEDEPDCDPETEDWVYIAHTSMFKIKEEKGSADGSL